MAAAAAVAAGRPSVAMAADVMAGLSGVPLSSLSEGLDGSYTQSVYSGCSTTLGATLGGASPSAAAAAMVHTERLRLLASSTSASTTTTAALSGLDATGALPGQVPYPTPSLRRQLLQRLARRRRAHARRLTARQTGARLQGAPGAEVDAGLPPRAGGGGVGGG
eukprot:TRINITY_DN4881_c0_g1_i2.p3 TRINITY_DN4881_c0_g1~~TRINITY_DN4881_c0_g1_i2.p3  ORF type:complete len:164 (-),score=56.65 TRINITY_DN4881_c0_g1_i2:3-494(-)